MAKREMIDLTTDVDTVGGLVLVEPAGPVVPVRRGEQMHWLQDGRYIPTWLVWLRRRRGLVLTALLMGVAYGLARWLLLARGE